MGATINQAFCEVYDIVNHMEKDLYNKIPQGFVDMLYKNRDTRLCNKYRLFNKHK